MATKTKANPRVYKGHMETQKILIASGQSWNAGQFLYTASGLLTAAASDAVNFRYYALETVSDPGNNTTYAKVGVITNDIVFVGNELDATATSAAWVDNNYAIDVTSNVVTVDTGDTGHDSVRIVGLLKDDEPIKNSSSDTYPLVLFKVLQSTLDADAS